MQNERSWKVETFKISDMDVNIILSDTYMTTCAIEYVSSSIF